MIKYAFFLNLSLIAINSLVAQQEDRFSYELYLTPKTAVVFFEDNDLGDYTHNFGLNIQFGVNYQWNDKFAVTTGLKYWADNFSTLDYDAATGCDFDSGSYDPYNSWVTNDFSIKYLGVPLEGRYYFRRQANQLYVKLGYEYFFKVGESRDASLVSCRGEFEQKYPSNIGDQAKNYGTKINFGIGWQITTDSKATITLEPEIAYSTLPVYEEEGIVTDLTNNVRLLDVGLRLGLRF